MAAVQKISDVVPRKIQFNSGDRILAKVSIDLKKDYQDRLIRSIEKFAGEPIRVLIVNCLDVHMEVKTPYSGQVICDPRLHHRDKTFPNILNLDVAIVQMPPNAELVVKVRGLSQVSMTRRKRMTERFKEWAGSEVWLRMMDYSL